MKGYNWQNVFFKLELFTQYIYPRLDAFEHTQFCPILVGTSMQAQVILTSDCTPYSIPGDSMSETKIKWRTLSLASMTLALMQSICTAVVAFSAIRVAIGLTSLAAVAGIYTPETGFHGDAIRIPMLILATLGALINLFVLFRIWSLRKRTSGNWRRPKFTKRKTLRALAICFIYRHFDSCRR